MVQASWLPFCQFCDHRFPVQVEVQASMQPQLASAEVASRLEVAGACQELPSGEQLALDMSTRLQRHEQCCKALLHQGQVWLLFAP